MLLSVVDMFVYRVDDKLYRMNKKMRGREGRGMGGSLGWIDDRLDD